MRSTDDPASLSLDDRLAELAGIFAFGVQRLRRQALPTVPTSRQPAPTLPSHRRLAPEIVSETLLTVPAS